MVYTRSDAKASFNHILDNVLGRGDGSPLKLALYEEGIDDIFALATLTESVIDSLRYKNKDNENALTPVKVADKMILKCFLHFVINSDMEGRPIFGDGWNEITQNEFDLFRINPKYMAKLTTAAFSMPSSPTSPKPPPPLTKAAPTYTPADLFRRGIKRDPTLFPTLKDEKFNDNWHRSFVNQARAQDVSEVLDPLYEPMDDNSRELFIEKQKYVYAILESKVLTDRGKAIVREYEDTFDAQKVYQKLTEHHLRSTKALIESSSILSYITSARLGSGEWNGTTEGFITHWSNQVRLYERQVPFIDHFSDGQKRIMLENAVAPISELRQVKNTADLEKTKTGRSLTYEEYLSLLLSAATTYDIQFASKKQKRQVFNHSIVDYDDDIFVAEEDDYYDIDAPVSVILANSTERRNKYHGGNGKQNVRMPRDKWFSLDTKSKEIWDKLDDKAKSIILGYDSGNNTSSPKPFNKPSSFQRKVNLHEMSAYDFIQAYSHQLDTSTPEDSTTASSNDHDTPTDDGQDDNDTRIVNAATSSSSKLPPGDIRRVVSKSSKRMVNKCEYCVSAHRHTSPMSLVDRGANGGVAGADVRVIFKTSRTVDIKGIDNHQVVDVPIGTVGGVVTTQKGPVIAILHQYALLRKGASIHSPCQLEAYKNDVNDKSVHIKGGLQRIKTLDGYVIPLCIQSGLARLPIRPYTDHEWETLPHVILNAETEWDPSVLDHAPPEDSAWGVVPGDNEDSLVSASPFDEFGQYRKRVIVQYAGYFASCDNPHDIEDVIDKCVFHAQHPWDGDQVTLYNANEHEIDGTDVDDDTAPNNPVVIPKTISKRPPDYAALRPFFGWLSPKLIQKTFENTTQYARIPCGTMLKRTFKSPNPALNVTRRNEAVACDIVYADTPAIHDGSTSAVIFVGVDTQVTDVYGIKTDKQFVNTLEDNIIQRGAPNKLISDRAQVIISNKIVDILRTLCIGSWQSEPHQQQQNPAERRYQTLKTTANRVMDRTGAPPNTWLLCLQYVCYLLNHSYNITTGGVPLTQLTGSTVDISALLRFYFWQKVYYKAVDVDFPSDSPEAVGHIVGISEHCGHALTWKILTVDSNSIIFRSLVRPFSPDDPNLRADMLGGEASDLQHAPIIKSRHDPDHGSKPISTSIANDDQDNENGEKPSVVFNPEELVGRTFLMDPHEDGQQFRARIVKLIKDHEDSIEDNPTKLKFLLSVNDDKAEEVITYNKLLEYLAKQDEDNVEIPSHCVSQRSTQARS